MNQNRGRLLIVDDTPENIELLRAVLKRDYEIVSATSGQEALAFAQRESPTDLVLLDVSMPIWDGYEVCSRLKELPNWNQVPVIFVTGLDNSEDEERGLRAGAVDYITKPFQPALVKARLRNHLDLKRHRDNLEAEVQRRSQQLLQAHLERDRLKSDLQLALKLQLSLLPPGKSRQSGTLIATALRPARTIGGDFYDYLPLGRSRLLFAVGDVSDKGVASALFMVKVVTVLHWLAASASCPAELLRDLNIALCADNDACMFVTLGLGIIDQEGQVLYASAGHESPVLVTPNQPAQCLELAGGPALGLFEEAEYPLHKLQITPGQSLLLVSDGVTEANNHQQEEYGYERLIASLDQLPQGHPDQLLQTCLSAVAHFTDGAEPSDDLTVLILTPEQSANDPIPTNNQVLSSTNGALSC